ncbi:Hypothetical protein MVR_LOCUS37 [uncultured virus]|nr:Hypothetical protein MVR_LOCUS37 [uncultured virus]
MYESYPNYQASNGYASMLSKLYEEIAKTFTAEPLSSQIKLSTNTDSKIRERLEALRKSEAELMEEFKRKILDEEVYKRSGHTINISKVPKELVPSILEKHAKMLGLTSAYNNNAKAVLEMLQAISDTSKGYASTPGAVGNPQLSIRLTVPGTAAQGTPITSYPVQTYVAPQTYSTSSSYPAFNPFEASYNPYVQYTPYPGMY